MNNSKPFPHGSITDIQGKGIAIKGDDIDTDRIIPARFLKCVSFDFLGDQVFADDRNEMNGKHPFDKKENQNASILIVNGNFGCGSSREHAPQALMRWGIRALIGESFAEIFYGNCLALGIPCATTEISTIKELQLSTLNNIDNTLHLDIASKCISNTTKEWEVDMDKGPREMFLSGRWDATSQLIEKGLEINKVSKDLPYLNGFQ